MFTEITRQVTESLVQRIGRHRFELWFTAPHSIAVIDNRLHVNAGDAFSLGRIRSQFDEDLRHVAREHPGLGLEVLYNVLRISAGSDGKIEPALKRCSAAAASTSQSLVSPDERRRSNKQIASTQDALANFVFGKENLLAENGVRQVIAQPGQITPFYLHGPVGSGKSSLLNLVVRVSRGGQRRTRSIFVTAEQFTSQFVEALDGRGLPVFRRKFRDLDVLAIDDLQFFNSKRATLVEFQSTLDHFLRNGKQVVLAADRPPNELKFLAPEVINRLSSGLVCRLNYPCAAGRKIVLEQACALRQLKIPTQFVGMIAERLDGDMRKLTGAVNRLQAAQLSQMDLAQWSTIQSLLQDLFQASTRLVSIETIEQAVCDFCGVAAQDLRSPKRTKRINVARNLAMWLARKHTGHAFSEIGLHYGGRSHSTVISAQQKVSRWLQGNESIPLSSAASCSAADAIHRIESKLRIG